MWMSMAMPLYVAMHVVCEHKLTVLWHYFQMSHPEQLSPSSCICKRPGCLSHPDHCKDSLRLTEAAHQGSGAPSGAPNIPTGTAATSALLQLGTRAARLTGG